MSVMRKDATGWILMSVALILALLAYWLVQQYLAQEASRLEQEAQAARGSMAATVVASRALRAGDVISEASMSIGRLPGKHIPARAVRPQDFEQVSQRVLNRPMSPGEPLLADFVSGLVVNRFSELLPPGTRAVSVRVSALESHSGLLLPGDYIDLFAQLRSRSGQGRSRLLGLFERVQVLAAGQQPLRSSEQAFQPLNDHSRDYSYVTLALPARQAEDLLRARAQGDIVYLLRGPEDDRQHFAESGIEMFSDQADPEVPVNAAASTSAGGYTYYSSNVPRGERRGQQRSPAKQPRIRALTDEMLAAATLDEQTLLQLIQRPVPAASAQAQNPSALRSLAHVAR